MPAAESTATSIWEGDLPSGAGRVSVTSGTLDGVAVSWAARTSRTPDATSPEELLAAAHAACFSMAFAHGLAGAGTVAERLEVTATVSFEELQGGGWGVASSRLRVRGTVPGIDADAFARAAEDAGANCPISRALGGNVAIEVEAALA